MKDPFQEAVRARLETVSSLDGHLTVPVEPEKIAEQLGLEVARTPLESNVGGFILKKHGEASRIYVNSNDPQERQKFTLAHEIGHYWLHRDDNGEFGYVEYRGELSTRGTDPVERWANSFATELIMPARYIRMAWARGDSIEKLKADREERNEELLTGLAHGACGRFDDESFSLLSRCIIASGMRGRMWRVGKPGQAVSNPGDKWNRELRHPSGVPCFSGAPRKEGEAETEGVPS